MRFWKRTGGVCLAVAFSAAPLTAQEIATTVLDNGLEVIVIENHSVPLVTIEMDVRNGAFTESPEYDGLSHLYEHMFFKANRTIPDQESYMARVRQLGAVFNGTTSEERVNYYFTLGVDSVRAGLKFMEDAIRYPLFLQEELERERPVVLGEYDRNEANPFFHLNQAVSEKTWSPGYHSRKNVIGDREIIATATQEKMFTVQERFYVPNNSALILSGDITPEEGFGLAEEVFGEWPRGPDPFAEPVSDPPPLETPDAVIVELPVQATASMTQWQGPSVDDDPEATYAADLMIYMLNRPGSPFQKALVDSGLAVGANFSYYTLSHVGPITVFAQTTPGNVVELQRAIHAEIARLGDPGYFSDEDMSSAKTQMAINETYSRESSNQLAHTVGFWWAVAGIDYYESYIENIQQVTHEDIARFVGTYLEDKPFVTGVLISPEAREEVGLVPEDLLAVEEVVS
jgi:zinc protease